MKHRTVSLDKTHTFSNFFLDYIQGKESLADFYECFPKLEFFKHVLIKKKFEDNKRKILTQVLQAQYHGLDIPKPVGENIQKLNKETTFTVTTGHQLNIFTGPIYFLYKIITTINTCKLLKASYPHYDFVPVYWMASEDHDFQEINHCYLDNKKYEWETNQTGAVGKFQTNNELKNLLPILSADSLHFFKEAYQLPTLSDATRSYVNAMFGKEGLVVLDPDNKLLKKILQPIINDDLLYQGTYPVVSQTNDLLHKKGYKSYAYCREINFFYMDTGIRSRIEKRKDTYTVLGQNITFTRDTLEHFIQQQPEKFSPNVILRPLYQELILPNLAYVGGPTEILYWLQLKNVFKKHNITFPILMPRNFATIIPKNVSRKWQKTTLDETAIFLGTQQAFNLWVKTNNQKMPGFDNIDCMKY